MKSKRPVLASKVLPTRIPLLPGVTLWLLIDRLGVPAWVQGAIMTLWALLVIGAMVTRNEEQDYNPFEKQP